MPSESFRIKARCLQERMVLKVSMMATTILVAIMILAIQALTVLEGLAWTSIAIALMVLMMLISTDFRAAAEGGRSWILHAALQAFLAGLMAYIICSPATYQVEDESLVTACIIPATFLLACFAFEIDVYELKRKWPK